MADRQVLVVELAGRQVGSLRELSCFEARQVSEKLSARKQQNSLPSIRTSGTTERVTPGSTGSSRSQGPVFFTKPSGMVAYLVPFVS